VATILFERLPLFALSIDGWYCRLSAVADILRPVVTETPS
jgi:hypothetical protein